MVMEIYLFLGVTNYYKQFIQEYSVNTTPFLDLLKMGNT